MEPAPRGVGLVGQRLRLREVALADGAEHPQEGDPAALDAVLADLVDQLRRPRRPAGSQRVLTVVGGVHRQVEGAPGRPAQVALVPEGEERPLQGPDQLVVVADEPGGRAEVVELGGAEAVQPAAGPRVVRGLPVAAREVVSGLIHDFEGTAVQAAVGRLAVAFPSLRERAAIRSATYAASRPTPGRTIELNAYWKHRPQKNSPGASATTPRISRGHPSSPRIGRWIQSKTWRKPVAHTTVRHLARGPVDHGPAVADLLDPAGDPLDPALEQVPSLDADHRAAVAAQLVHQLVAHRAPSGEDVLPGEEQDGEDRPERRGPEPGRDLAAVAAGQDRRVRLGQLVGDVGAGVARADDEHRAVADLAGPAVLARVQLQDRPGRARRRRPGRAGSGRTCRSRRRRCGR